MSCEPVSHSLWLSSQITNFLPEDFSSSSTLLVTKVNIYLTTVVGKIWRLPVPYKNSSLWTKAEQSCPKPMFPYDYEQVYWYLGG